MRAARPVLAFARSREQLWPFTLVPDTPGLWGRSMHRSQFWPGPKRTSRRGSQQGSLRGSRQGSRAFGGPVAESAVATPIAADTACRHLSVLRSLGHSGGPERFPALALRGPRGGRPEHLRGSSLSRSFTSNRARPHSGHPRSGGPMNAAEITTTGPERWRDKHGIAEHFSCGVRWIESRMEEGMPHVHIAGRAKFRVSEVERWLDCQGFIERARTAL